jgi:hypothetical protein
MRTRTQTALRATMMKEMEMFVGTPLVPDVLRGAGGRHQPVFSRLPVTVHLLACAVRHVTLSKILNQKVPP